MTKNRLKAIAAASAAASALFALTAPSAQAAEIPKVLNGFADSQALHITLRAPSIPQLRAAMIAAGLPVDALPAVDVSEPLVQTLTVALNHGGTNKSGASMHSGGYAIALSGGDTEPTVETSCRAASCSGATAAQSLAAHRLDLPSSLGYLDIAGASSTSTTHLSTSSKTAAIDVNVSLESVLQNQSLAAVSSALETLRGQLNTTVVPALNGAIDTVQTTVDDVAALAPLKAELDRIITVDHVKPIPDLSKVDLVTGRVLAGAASLADETRDGTTGLLARSGSEIVDLELLGGWASIGSIKVLAEAFANSVKGAGGADANSRTDIANVDLGGLLGVHVSADDLIHLTQSSTVKALARDTMKELGLNQDITDIENAIELVYDVAGISIVKLGNTEKVSPAGILAEATANSLLIKIEPKLPNFTKLQAGLAGGHVPLLADSDYVPTGLSLTVELPNASASVAATSVQSVCIGSCVPVTGIGTPWIVALSMLALALLVKRFALAR